MGVKCRATRVAKKRTLSPLTVFIKHGQLDFSKVSRQNFSLPYFKIDRKLLGSLIFQQYHLMKRYDCKTSYSHIIYYAISTTMRVLLTYIDCFKNKTKLENISSLQPGTSLPEITLLSGSSILHIVMASLLQ